MFLDISQLDVQYPGRDTASVRGVTLGLRAGDIVLAINGKKVADSNDLINQTTALKPGTRAEFSVRRSSELKKITVLLGERPTVKKR